jgi:hypothetical protein
VYGTTAKIYVYTYYQRTVADPRPYFVLYHTTGLSANMSVRYHDQNLKKTQMRSVLSSVPIQLIPDTRVKKSRRTIGQQRTAQSKQMLGRISWMSSSYQNPRLASLIDSVFFVFDALKVFGNRLSASPLRTPRSVCCSIKAFRMQ